MLYARVVLGLPVEGPFDYIVPFGLEKKAKAGSRVWVSFGQRKMLGFIVALTNKTRIRKLKKISQVLDESPLLHENMLALTRELSQYYCCSWGEAIETALPLALRKGKKLIGELQHDSYNSACDPEIVLLHDLNGENKWSVYLEAIKSALSKDKSSILLFPDKNSAFKAKEIIEQEPNLSCEVLYRNMPGELGEWLKIRQGKTKVVVATISGVFAPVNNLGLIIIDDEDSSGYKQDQVPHYHAREVAIMRINIEKAKLILASRSPSLDSFYLYKKNRLKYFFPPQSRCPAETRIVDMQSEYNSKQKDKILSRYLHDAVLKSLNSQEKILLFLNRKGFATFASCNNCGLPLKCPRCDINLVYHFKTAALNCNYCNFRMDAPKICPACESGYIKFSGMGTEKIESELSRLLPQAKIKILDSNENIDLKEADIFVSTSSVLRHDYKFALTGILSIDNSLNRINLRSSEKTFSLLTALLALTERQLIIQTKLVKHYVFRSLINNDVNIFYDEELKYRRQLDFPPYTHFGLVKLRGKTEQAVRKSATSLFNKLNQANNAKGIKIVSLNAAAQHKLRGNFYWHVLAKAHDAKKLSRYLKINLRNLSHSGIIVTVDIDPID